MYRGETSRKTVERGRLLFILLATGNEESVTADLNIVSVLCVTLGQKFKSLSKIDKKCYQNQHEGVIYGYKTIRERC